MRVLGLKEKILLFSTLLWSFSPLRAASSRGAADAVFRDAASARFLGMGGTGGALNQDLSPLPLNPAGFSENSPSGFSVSYAPAYFETRAFSAAAGRSLGRVYVEAGGYQYGSSDIEITDAAGSSLGTKDFFQRAASISIGTRAVPFYFPRGATLKYFQSRFSPYEADGVGLDLGWRADAGFARLGATWQDIGGLSIQGKGYNGGTVSDGIPSRVRVGVALASAPEPLRRPKDVPDLARDALGVSGILTADVVFPLNSKKDDRRYSLGGELWFHRLLALRAGWNRERGYSLGTSLNLRRLRLDYAFLFTDEVSNLQKLTTTFFFGGARAAP